jgi:putative nucleotidyltransferase with HDIG domain
MSLQKSIVTRVRGMRVPRTDHVTHEMWRGELLVGGAYILAALGLALASGVQDASIASAAIYTVAIAVAMNVRFDVGNHYTVPTQAVFVPMLFALPPGMVVVVMPVALAIGMLPRIVRGELGPSWLITAVGNSWFAIGPALVLALAGGDPDQQWAVLLAALAAQFTCDFAASVARERLYGELGARELIDDYRVVYAMDVALSGLGLTVAYASDQLGSDLAVLLIGPLFAILRYFSKERRERLQQLAELNDAYQGTALLLGDLVEADDTYTGEHCKGVVRLALAVADELGLEAGRKRAVEFGALLHDVGKIAVPKEIINKRGRLDEREWAIMKTHTIEGQRMLDRIGGLMLEIGRIVRASHERWDGTGYPDGLAGEDIPLESRIVSACDAFNAMTTTRSYRAAMSLAEAREELERNSGTQFDPAVVKALVSVVFLEELPTREASVEVESRHAGAYALAGGELVGVVPPAAV